MTAPGAGLRDAVARCIDPDAWRVWDAWKDRPDGRMHYAAALWRDKSLLKADAILAGPLTTLRAEVEQVKAERDHEQGLATTWRRAAEDWQKERDGLLDDLFSRRDQLAAAEAETTRLRALLDGAVEGLTPFAAAIDDRERRAALIAQTGGQMAADDTDVAYVELRHLRRARETLAALTPTQKDPT